LGDKITTIKKLNYIILGISDYFLEKKLDLPVVPEFYLFFDLCILMGKSILFVAFLTSSPQIIDVDRRPVCQRQ